MLLAFIMYARRYYILQKEKAEPANDYGTG